MASYATVPAYVTDGQGWEERFKEHPVWAFMFEYEESFDRGNLKSIPFAQNPYLPSNFVWNFNGTASAPGEASWNALIQMYGPFTAHHHEPGHVVVTETATGYELIGIAKLFGNLPVPGEQAHADLSGKKWDVCAPGCFSFKFVKNAKAPHGMQMSEQVLIGDGITLMTPMVARGMITPEQAFAGPPQ